MDSILFGGFPGSRAVEKRQAPMTQGLPGHCAEHSCIPLVELTPRFQAGLSILRESHEYALQMQRPKWDFAVEIRELRTTAGLTSSDLRWLVCRGIVEHASEVTCQCQDGRVFRPTGRLTFTKRTCFVLAGHGAAAAFQDPGTSTAQPLPHAPLPSNAATPVPQWDKERQELRLGRLLVKQFKVPAPNQEVILASFQEEGWPPRIDDPLPPQANQDSKRRLHDTITTLNRHQKHRLIRFSGDGSGEGVRWDPFSCHNKGVSPCP